MSFPLPRAASYARPLLLAFAVFVVSAPMAAGESLLEPAVPPLPGQTESLGGHDPLPRFLEPLSRADSAPAVAPSPGPTGFEAGWVGDSWMWSVGIASRLDSARLQAAAEQDFATLDWMRRGFARLTVVLLCCAAIASFAVLFTLAQRR